MLNNTSIILQPIEEDRINPNPPYVNHDIKLYMMEHPLVTKKELRAVFCPRYTEKTVNSQHGRCYRTINNIPFMKRKKKDKPNKVKRDPEHYQRSLDRRSAIPHATFVPTEQAAPAANGNKRHVNLTTAQQDAHNKAVMLAEDWVAWLRCVESAPKNDKLVDFTQWMDKPHRKEKLMKRIDAFNKIHEQLMFALDCLVDVTQTPAANDDSQSHETNPMKDTRECNL